MKRIVYMICSLIVPLSLSAQTLKPIKTNVGKLNISIDPRMELLGAIQVTADYPLATKNTPYSNEIKEYFVSMKDSKGALMTNELFYNGFNNDAPTSFMLYLSQPYALKETISYSQYLIERSKGKDKLDEYRDAISDFSNKSKFKDFWKSKEDFYKQSLSLICEELKGIDPIKIIEDYYKDSHNSYNIIICPLLGSRSYGPKIENKNGSYDIYSLTSTSYNKDGVPFINKEVAEYLVLHEFSHSFVNPLTEKYIEQVNLSEKLFKPIEYAMSKHAYVNWEITLNEHIVRAFTARAIEIQYGKQACNDVVRNELQKGFVYIEHIIEMLREYEKERDTHGTTFAQYFPTLLSAIAKLEPTFMGNINDVINTSKIICIYPTEVSDSLIMDKIKESVVQFVELAKQKLDKEFVVLPDSIALNSQLDNCGLLCYGTIQSNLFLSHYADILPFKINNEILIADKEYNNPELRLISCIPNPKDNKCGMIIYTALKDENIININNHRYGKFDFQIFNDQKNVISQGYYYKVDKLWKFNN